MKFDEYLALEKSKPARKPQGHKESDLQIACVKWFQYQYSHLDGLLFHVPNGRKRDARDAMWLKREGVVSGVSDLLLLVPRGGYHGLCIELKTKDGKQSDLQKKWQGQVENVGYKYIVVRSLEQFVAEVTLYLSAQDEKKENQY